MKAEDSKKWSARRLLPALLALLALLGAALGGYYYLGGRCRVEQDGERVDYRNRFFEATVETGGRLVVKVDGEVVLEGGAPEVNYVEQGAKRLDAGPPSFVREESIVRVKIPFGSPEAEAEITYLFDKNSPRIEILSRWNYKKEVRIREERLVYSTPFAEVEGFDHEGRWRKLPGLALFTPQVPAYGSLGGKVHLTGESDADLTAFVQDARGSKIIFWADSYLAHPVPTYEETDTWKKPKASYRNSAQRGLPGLMRSHRFVVTVGPAPRFIRLSLHPEGRQATIVFTEHADLGDLEGNKALYFGTSETSSMDYNKKGFVGHGVKVSKTAFLKGQLDRKEWKSFFDNLVSHGVAEIGPHTMSDGHDGSLLRQGFDFFKKYYRSRFWIDHGGSMGPGKEDSNDEALGVRGWDKSDPSYVLGLLDRYGYDYAWSYFDQGRAMKGFGSCFNLLQPEVVSEEPELLSMKIRETPGLQVPPLLLYYNNVYDHDPFDDKRIYLFNTFPFRFVSKAWKFLYNKRMIDKLVREGGVHVSHSYFGADFHEGILFHRDSIFKAIDEEFDKKLAYIGDLANQGVIWNPFLTEWGDWMTRLRGKVRIVYEEPGRFRVINDSERMVPGLTVVAPDAEEEQVRLPEGKRARFKKVGRDLYFWFDLQPEETVLLRVE